MRAEAGARPASTARRRVDVIEEDGSGMRRRVRRDVLATEEPLEIRVARGSEAPRRLSVTMRTPGADFELAAGFLYDEGLVRSADDVRAIRYCTAPGDGVQRYNVVTVELADDAPFDPARIERNSYTSSSCGICGKASIEAACGPTPPPARGAGAVRADVLLGLPDRLRAAQRIFERTGGLHAAALFDTAGHLLRLREDVGRHNALDKLVGASLLGGELPLTGRVALMSGRLSFELVQKAARAGIGILVGVSAPSSLAVELAEEVGMTLIGFLRAGRFNVYTGAEHVVATRAEPVPA
ncbi:MAG TPA: formate dehydrogenase accessory sulfurtransferase FdhD [Longimicrobiaceae bacterium]|jgi:FdhD protein|nr:formate dehydrogenase accessory sulfurtransferase FdhD [Longimicrobiaceae bacterium]